MKLRIDDCFSNDDDEFSNKDYIYQIIENGQLRAFREFVPTIDSNDLLNFVLENYNPIRYETYMNMISIYLSDCLTQFDNIKK